MRSILRRKAMDLGLGDEVVTMLVVDPWHWLKEAGSLPDEPARLRSNALKVARLLEYGGPLEPGHCRETLVECSKRPKGRRCPGLLWVTRLHDKTIHAGCMMCRQDEIHISNWQETEWADGPMEPVSVAGPGEVR
ncbi:MAG TPA: hypothetical protein VGK67_32235 [Myxococcales bacterium]